MILSLIQIYKVKNNRIINHKKLFYKVKNNRIINHKKLFSNIINKIISNNNIKVIKY